MDYPMNLTESQKTRFEYFLIFWGFLIIFWGGRHVVGDGFKRYMALSHFLEKGEIVGKYSIIGPLFSAPLYWLGMLIQPDNINTTITKRKKHYRTLKPQVYFRPESETT